MAVNSVLPMAGFVSGKPIMVNFDAGGSTYTAGDVIVCGQIPCVAHEDIPAYTGGTTRDALSVGNGVYKMVADGALAIGQIVYWDATNKKVTATSSGNKIFGFIVGGPTFLLNAAGPAADLDACWVLHHPHAA